MEAIMMIFLGAILVEAIVSALKPIYDPEKRTIAWGQVVSLFVAWGVAFAAGLNLPAAVGVQIGWPVVPELITGILISRGANYVYDILSQIKNSVKKQTSQGTGEKAE